MKIYIPGEDARMQAVRAEAVQRGHALASAEGCDCVLLPLPDSAPFAPPLLGMSGRGRRVLYGRLLPSQRRALQNRGWQLENIQQNEAYIRENALITAEGALHAAMSHLDCTLRGALCAVVGYGRIGRALTRLLLSLGARVQVAARRQESRSQAEADGAQAFAMAELSQAFSGARVLFSTVPCQIITSDALRSLADGALVMELASPPYGFDLEAAGALGFDAVLESALPARYAPRTAAALLLMHLEGGDLHG